MRGRAGVSARPVFPKIYSLRASEEVCPKHRNVHREIPVAARQSCPATVFVLCCNRARPGAKTNSGPFTFAAVYDGGMGLRGNLNLCGRASDFLVEEVAKLRVEIDFEIFPFDCFFKLSLSICDPANPYKNEGVR